MELWACLTVRNKTIVFTIVNNLGLVLGLTKG